MLRKKTPPLIVALTQPYGTPFAKETLRRHSGVVRCRNNPFALHRAADSLWDYGIRQHVSVTVLYKTVVPQTDKNVNENMRQIPASRRNSAKKCLTTGESTDIIVKKIKQTVTVSPCEFCFSGSHIKINHCFSVVSLL